jgi:hypothetical protein
LHQIIPKAEHALFEQEPRKDIDADLSRAKIIAQSGAQCAFIHPVVFQQADRDAETGRSVCAKGHGAAQHHRGIGQGGGQTRQKHKRAAQGEMFHDAALFLLRPT